MKLMLLFLTATLTVDPATSYEDIRINVVEFQEHYEKFARALFGCPKDGPVNESTCDPRSGIIDYQAWKKAGKAAKKLFGD